MSTQVESLRRFLAGRAPTHGAETGTALVVGSGKGGVGTSTLAALIALRAVEEGRRALLVDGEENPGTLHMLLGVDAGPGLAALRGGTISPEALMVPVVTGLELVTGWPAGEESELGAAERRALLRRVSGSYGAFDRVIVDAGSRLDGVLGACGAGARRLLAVSGSDRVSLAATHALIKAVSARLPRLPIAVLFNGCDDAEARGAFEVLRTGVGHFLARAVDFAGSIPEDPALRQAVGAGSTLTEAAASSPITSAVHGLDPRVLFEGMTGPRLARFVTIPHAKG